MRLEVGLKLKKTLGEVEALPFGEFLLWVSLLTVKAEEQKKAAEKGRKR